MIRSNKAKKENAKNAKPASSIHLKWPGHEFGQNLFVFNVHVYNASKRYL